MDYPTLALVGGIMLFSYGLIARLIHLNEIKIKSNIAMYREKNQVVQIDQLLDQLPRMSQELEKMKMEMQARGATAEQLAPINQRRQMISTVQQFEPFLRMGGPIINRLLKWGLKLLG